MKRYLFFFVLVFPQFVSAEEVFFSCKLERSDGSLTSYTFSFNEEIPRLYLNDSSQEMEIIRLNSSQLWASQTLNTFRDFDYDDLTFYLDRVSGNAEISYSKEPTEEEIAECEAKMTSDQKWTCKLHPVLVDRAERGTCRVLDRKI